MQNYIWKLNDEYGNWSKDQNYSFQVITSEFYKRSKKDVEISVEQAVPFSKHSWLTPDAMEEVKILYVLRQLNLQDQTVFMSFSTRNAGISMVRSFV